MQRYRKELKLDAQNKITEEELLRLKLNQERGLRISAELAHLELAKEKLQAAGTQLQVEHKAFFNTIREKYSLKPEDLIGEDGTILKKQKEEKKD